jgi:hypothetical protein
VGIVGLVLFAFSPPMIRISCVMRGYALLMCLFFGALYFAARLLKKPSPGSAIGLTACLLAANLTHYCAAWFTLVLGVVVLVPVLARQLPLKVAGYWAGGQVMILSLCGFLYLSHVSGFVQSEMRDEMWGYWIRDVQGAPGLGLTIKLMAVKTLQFMTFCFGKFFFLVPVAIVWACWLLARQRREENPPKSLMVSRLALILVPWVVANALLCAHIYPLGPTRHSMWMAPFVVAAVAISLSQCFLPGRRLSAILGTLLLGLWTVSHSIIPIARIETPMSIANIEKTVAVFKDRIPSTDVVIVDDATRNVLDYYLGREDRNPPKKLAKGYAEYVIGGYRVISLPKFYLFQYNLRENWCEFLDSTGTGETSHFWLVYLGYDEKGTFSIERIGPLLPRVRSYKRWPVSTNEIIRLDSPLSCPKAQSKSSLAMQ